MATDFVMLSYTANGVPAAEEVRSRLAPYGEVLSLGRRGLRFIPQNPAWPVTYFNPDGTIHLVNKDLYLDDIETYLETLCTVLNVTVTRCS
ncbi:MAG: hypothetical protein HY710_14940 [Candidatus Latescibacteria bacterium]|nr:hypothetical protein [Candidatus Latescibacterota bacterium]